jgi:hypothetical protein
LEISHLVVSLGLERAVDHISKDHRRKIIAKIEELGLNYFGTGDYDYDDQAKNRDGESGAKKLQAFFDKCGGVREFEINRLRVQKVSVTLSVFFDDNDCLKVSSSFHTDVCQSIISNWRSIL